VKLNARESVFRQICEMEEGGKGKMLFKVKIYIGSPCYFEIQDEGRKEIAMLCRS
jgi:hypothetical protein